MSKVVFASDVHGYLDGASMLRHYARTHGIREVFLLGDYSVGFKDKNQNKADAQYFIEVLKGNAKVHALPGNCDHPELLPMFEKEKVDFHENMVAVDGVKFVGFGGSNPTPFGTPSELGEEEIHAKLSALLGKVGEGKVVLVVHAPPKDTVCDVIPDGSHAGSEAIRKIIEEFKPAVCVCSHIHESAGKQEKIGETVVINVGPLSHGNAVVLDTEDLSVRHVQLN